jgi:hypothetical protein
LPAIIQSYPISATTWRADAAQAAASTSGGNWTITSYVVCTK